MWIDLFAHKMIMPGEMTLSGAVYKVSTKMLIGSNSMFEYSQIDLIHSPETNKLYLWEPNNMAALKLIDFIQILLEEQPACYYYSRMEKSGLSLISYHIAKSSNRIVEANPEISYLFDELKA